MAEEKQYQASAKKLRKAREKGDLPRSQIFSQAGLFSGIVVIILVGTPIIWERIAFLVQYAWTDGFSEPLRVLWLFSVYGGSILALTIGSIALLGLALDGAQIGILWRPTLALPDLNRINLASGLAKSFGGLKSCFVYICRIGIFFLVTYWLIFELFLFRDIYLWVSVDGITYSISVLVDCLIGSTVAFLIFGMMDLLKTHRQYKQKHTMSLDELRRENKEDEGNPEFRTRRKMLHRALISQDLVQRVRNSKVIIVSKRGA